MRLSEAAAAVFRNDYETALCAMIERREIALDDPHLRDHLRESARDRLAIDQPRYRSLL